MIRKKQYVIGLDYSPEKQHRLKRFVGAMGYNSIRAFIVKVLDERIEEELNTLPPDQRRTVEQLMNNGGMK